MSHTPFPQPCGLWGTVVLANVGHQRWPGNAASTTVKPQSPAHSPAEKDLGAGLTGCWDAGLKTQNSLWSEGLSVEKEREPVLNRTLAN